MIGFYVDIFNSNYKEIINKLIKNNINCMQISFKIKKPINYIHFIEKNNDIKYFKKICKKHNFLLFTHASYGAILCKKNSKLQIKSLINDIICGNILCDNNYVGTIVHIGRGDFEYLKHNLIILNDILNKKYKNSYIIIENEYLKDSLCQYINQIRDINNLNLKNIKFCIDTCHLYCTYKGKSLKKLFEEINEKIDIKTIACVHLNDCKRKYYDEHASIFAGVIPKEDLIYVHNFCLKNNIPMILENKGDDISLYDQIKSLKNNNFSNNN